MTIESAFQEDIAERPDDNGVRLIYADWLEENCQAARAAFVRDQVELARMDVGDARYPALLARVRRSGVFTDQGRIPWVDHIPNAKVMFRRGLIAAVGIPVEAYCKQSPDDWRRVPVEALQIVRTGELSRSNLAHLCQRTELARLRMLHLARHWRTEEMRPLLTDCDKLADLADVRIESHYDFHESLISLGPQLALPGLRSLRLHQYVHPDAWIPFLDGCRTPLQRVHLSYEDDDIDRMPRWDWIANTIHWSNLRYLKLDHWSTLRETDAETLYSPKQWRTALSRAGCLEDLTIYSDDLVGLTGVTNWGPLQTLRISDFDSVEMLSSVTQLRQLRRLELGVWDPDDEGLVVAMPNLRRFGVSCVEDDEWPRLLAGVFTEGLYRLDLGITIEQGVSRLANLSLPGLRCLSLKRVSELSALGSLLQSNAMPNLCTLLLDTVSDRVTARSLRPLARAKAMPHLSLVRLDSNNEVQWWVLGDGEAKRVRKDVLPVDGDWWLDANDVTC